MNTPVRLEVIPLGVDTEAFAPSTPPQRRQAREALGVADAEMAILFVGRLSHHAKAHPFPMFRAISIAAERTGRPLHLMVAGWAANDAVRAAFVDGASAFSQGIRVSFLDGTDSVVRRAVWRAADIFITLAESVQETFGLTVVEAMASGLPVVATDWDGYRDLVEDGSSGHLVPTAMVRGATSESSGPAALRRDRLRPLHSPSAARPPPSTSRPPRPPSPGSSPTTRPVSRWANRLGRGQ